MGENPATSGVARSRYPYPVHGTWDRYWFDVGNIRFLMMSDVNERSQAQGRGPLGGNPGGVVTAETFDWWADMVERSRGERIVVTVHHYVLKETTVASGEWEGMKKGPDGAWQMDYHGYYPAGTPNGASYLLLGRRRGGFRAFRALSRGQSRRGRPVVRRPHPHQPGRRARRQIPYRDALRRHDLRQRPRRSPAISSRTTPCRTAACSPSRRAAARLRIRCYMHTSEHRPAGLVRRQGTPDYAEQALYLGSVRGHLVRQRRRAAVEHAGGREIESLNFLELGR